MLIGRMMIVMIIVIVTKRAGKGKRERLNMNHENSKTDFILFSPKHGHLVLLEFNTKT